VRGRVVGEVPARCPFPTQTNQAMPKQTKSNRGDEPRFVGTNWEPEVRVKKRGAARGDMGRKVITTGTVTLECDQLIGRIVILLRQGKEVRLGDALRIFPCMLSDLKTMSVSTQAMKGLTSTLADKSARVVAKGNVVSGGEVAKAARQRHREYVEITPDTTVICNVCGNRIRIGRRLAGGIRE